jgi:hypothetical protein
LLPCEMVQNQQAEARPEGRIMTISLVLAPAGYLRDL